MDSIYNHIRKPAQRSGFTLVEVVVSMLIVSVMLVAALSTVGGSRLSQFKTSQTCRGQALAESLMAEILQQAYADPQYGPGSLGLGSDEIGDGSRSLWDDVDDYDGWSASPPEQKDGTQIAGLAGWQRSVDVAWIDPLDPSQVEGSESNAKRVIVTVTFQDMPVATLVAIRTAWE